MALFLAYVMAVSPTMAQSLPANVKLNGTSSGITRPNAFLFEPEVPFTSLKNIPTWSEIEQLLDNPYIVSLDAATPGNDQGFPSYRATGMTRRPGFGVTLPALLVHPLNYNPTTGEEMRLLNPGYPGGDFGVVNRLFKTSDLPAPNGTYTWTYETIAISPGSARITPGEPAPIDYNNPVKADPFTCVISLELTPPEGAILCGGDPGEPNYFGFGVNNSTGYSTPAVPGVASAGTPIPRTARLFDPNRGVIQPRNSGSGAGGLNKPSLGIPAAGGTPNNPNYLINVDPNNVTPSNENDYVRNERVARVLGKSLFWDMQVGSDGVQACGTCHFNGTGTDTRTRNQVNPNHIGGDLTLQIHGGAVPNTYDLVASDFPLHKLTNPEIAGDPACTTPLTANPDAIPYAGSGRTGALVTLPGYAASQLFSNPVSGTRTVCDAGNISAPDVNDVVSSMGVVFNKFIDIASIGSFLPASGLPGQFGVQAVMPEPRSTPLSLDATDPIPLFKGLRRVEPRNTPTMQAAGFNFDNFWDGRARHDFNGGSVFGPSDPQSHVWVATPPQTLTPTRQIIRFVSIASLATGPGLSEFEMSFSGRNWAKIGKKLLQGTVGVDAAGSPTIVGTVTPLANQLVDPTDSVLGPYSNQRGSLCAGLNSWDRSPAGIPAVGKPGLCISYPGLIRQAFYPALWQNVIGQHLNGCYTDTRSDIHPNQCGTGIYPAASVRVLEAGSVVARNNDPFDGYVLTAALGPVNPADTNQFRQMEGNFSLFWGLSIQKWVNILVPDNTPFDQFLDANPGAFAALGEPGEPGLVEDQLNCGQATPVVGDVNDPHYCFTPFGNFKRDPDVKALRRPTGEGGSGGTLVVSGGTRAPSDPDPLLGLDIFFSSNLSLKNPNFRTGRCGECHAIPTLTDHTMPFTSKINLMDAVAEFAAPGVELVVEPLARLRVISGFLLEAEINENGQDAVERRIVDQSIVANPADGFAYPGATAAGLPGFGPWTGADSAFLDNGIYNLGVRPIAEDLGRGGNDAFGWPLSLSVLMMKNLEGPGFNPGGDTPPFDQPAAPGIAMSNFSPGGCHGLFEPTAQDQRINPGCEGEPANPALAPDAPYLAPFVNNITVGDFPPELDEAGGAIGGMVNTLTDVAMIEGFMDTLGPFNPANVAAEVMNYGGFSTRVGDITDQMGTWPNVNRVQRMGSFKAAPLRNVELTGPYFHNGGKLTLRQVVDFYTRGGDFPISNKAHRDFNMVNMNIEIQSNLNEDEKVALVDFLLELTDERNRYDRAPFDHPEVIIPIDGTAPDNPGGRLALLANPLFRRVPEVGAAGLLTPEPTFLNVTKVRVKGNDANPGSAACDYAGGVVSHYCH